MTAAEMAARVLKRIDEDVAAPVTCTAAEVLAALNEAQELGAWLTLCLETTADWTLAANATYHSLRAAFPDFLMPLRLEIDGVRVRPAGLLGLDALDSGWQARPGTPLRYVTAGFNFAAIAPQPVEDTLARFTYARAPLRMVGDDFPEMPEHYHPALVSYAIYKVRLKEGAEGLARGVKYLNRFLDDMTALGDIVRARSALAHYDVLPFELRLYDRARLVKVIAAQKPRAA